MKPNFITEQQQPRIDQLDGLRGLASLNVLIGHFVIAFYRAWLSGDPTQSHNGWDTSLSTSLAVLVYNPYAGVYVFFVMSGFVLALYAHRANGPLLPMLARRWVRLCVPVILITILTYEAIHAGACLGVQKASVITGGNWLIYLYNPATYWIPLSSCIENIIVTFLSGRVGAVTEINPSLWTMPIELIGSFTLLSAYKFAGIWRLRAPFCLAIALTVAIVTCDTRYCCFSLGVLLFEVSRNLKIYFASPSRLYRAVVWLLGCGMLAFGIWLAATPFVFTGMHGYVLVQAYKLGLPISLTGMTEAGALLLVTAALFWPPCQYWFRMPACRYLGRISFMLYLVHLPVECSAGVFVFLHVSGSYDLRAALAFATTMALSVLISDLATRFIDIPATRLSRLFTVQGVRIRDLPGQVRSAIIGR